MTKEVQLHKNFKEPSQDCSLGLEPLQKSRSKIPKKPFFRIVKYESLHQAKLVRVKLWKISSCNLSNLKSSVEIAPDISCIGKNYLGTFENIQSTPTLKKSLKHVKKMNASGGAETFLLKFSSASWKLRDFKFTVSNIRFPLMNFLKRVINPKLTIFTLAHRKILEGKRYENKTLIKALCYFTNLNECNMELPYDSKGKGHDAPSKLYRFQRLEKLTLDNDSSYCFLVPKTLHNLKNLEELTLPMTVWGEYQEVLSDLGSLPKLRCLSLHFRGSQNALGEDNLSFLVNCQGIESLTLFMERVKVYSLEYLFQLKNLKELKFQEIGAVMGKTQEKKKFPRFSHLNKVSLHLRNTNFSLESFGEMLKANLELRELHLDLTFIEIAEMFKNQLTLPLESLSLLIPKSGTSYSDRLLEVSDLVRRHSTLKRLSFKVLTRENSELKGAVLQSLVSLPLLEEVSFIFPHDGEQNIQTNKPYIVFESLKNLKKLVVDFKRIKISPSQIELIAQHMPFYQTLSKFVFSGNFDRVSFIEYNKFMNTIREIRKNDPVEMIIYGYSTDPEKEASQFLNSKNSLWRINYDFE